MQCLLEGMSVAQEVIVREAKMMASDGKLTKEERDRATQLAYKHALIVAKGPALTLLSLWGERRAKSLIMQLLAKLKGNKNVNPTISPVLPASDGPELENGGSN